MCVCVCARVCVRARVCARVDRYLALVLICFVQVQIRYRCYKRKSVGAHPVHLQICVLFLVTGVCGTRCVCVCLHFESLRLFPSVLLLVTMQLTCD